MKNKILSICIQIVLLQDLVIYQEEMFRLIHRHFGFMEAFAWQWGKAVLEPTDPKELYETRKHYRIRYL